MFALETKTSKLLGWNYKYLCTFYGILNVCEIVICYACLDLIRNSCRPAYSHSTGGFVGSAAETYFYLATCACMVITCIFLCSFIVSHISFLLMERTILGIMFWLTATLLSFVTSLALIIFINESKNVEIYGYSHKAAASILGLINSALYLINTVKSYRACKLSWSYQ
ncbi:uncharacterized protein [Parasteatoda tepidariorum]|nr:uncharacterized protein LOC107444720 [Parasteatoda tepidariorum]